MIKIEFNTFENSDSLSQKAFLPLFTFKFFGARHIDLELLVLVNILVNVQFKSIHT